MSPRYAQPWVPRGLRAGDHSPTHIAIRVSAWVLSALVLFLGFSVGPLRGQAVWSTILGYVTDPSGAAVPDATVTVKNQQTGVISKATSDATGSFNITHLDPGIYDLVVQAKGGFKQFVQTGIQLPVSASVRVDAKLELGAVSQEITVAAQTAQLETESTQVATSFNSSEVANLPILGRNVTQLLQVVPGAERDTIAMGPGENPTENARVWVNGTWSGGQTYVLDGITDIDAGFSGLQVIVPLQDSVQELKASTADYDAEFGQTSGLVAQYVTKSGTNQLHGTLNYFNRNKDTFAADPTTEKTPGTGPLGKGIGVPPYNWNQGGFSLGGPIKKDKLFAFGAFQFNRLVQSVGQIVTVPDAQFAEGNFSAFATTNPIYDPTTGNADGTGRTQFSSGGTLNVIPTNRIDPVANNLLALLPQPNIAGTTTDNNYNGTVPSTFNQNQVDTRVDDNISDKDKVFVRYSYFTDLFINGSVLGTEAGGAAPSAGAAETGHTKEQQSAANWTHTFGPSLLTEARIGFNRFYLDALQADSGLQTDNKVGIPNINTGSPLTDGLAGLTIDGPYGAFVEGTVSGTGIPRFEGTTTLEGINNWTWMHGAHELRFGADLQRQEFNFLSVNASSRGNFTFDQGITGDADTTLYGSTGQSIAAVSGIGTASFLLGDPSEFDRAVFAQFPGERQTRLGIYGQDVWRVNRKLTVTLGVRWDKFTAVTAHFPGGLAKFDPNTGDIDLSNLGNNSKTDNIYSPDDDFSPRIGIAYRLSSKNVIRAGFGRSFFESGYDATFYHLTSIYPITAQQSITQATSYTPIFLIDDGPPASPAPVLPSNGLLPAPNGQTLKTRPNDWQTENMNSYNFTVERQLTPSMLVDVAYVGAVGTHLSWEYDMNSAVPGPGNQDNNKPFAQLYGLTSSPIEMMCNCSNSNYNSLQIQVKKEYSRNLTVNSNIVWEKNMSYSGDNPYDRRTDYGPGAGSGAYSGSWSLGTMDRAFTWNLTHTIVLPYGVGQRWGSGASGVQKALLGGWQFSGVTALGSGLGFTPEWSNSAELNVNWGQRANTVPGCNWRNVPGGQSRTQWWNQSCFADPGTVYGDAGTGSLRGPGAVNIDLALWKEFDFSTPLNREKTAVQFRAAAYNAFNFTNLSNPGWDADVPSNTEITSLMPSYTMRRFEFGVHVTW